MMKERYLLPVILKRALEDKRLEDIDRSLLVLLITILDVDRDSIVNTTVLAKRIHRKPSRVYKAIDRLCASGYIIRARKVDFCYTYRLQP
jgi:DNA-binding MarR family transcriptional regulator